VSLKYKFIRNLNFYSVSLNRLEKNPQKKGVVMRTKIVTPKKPNSAKRPVAKIVLSN